MALYKENIIENSLLEHFFVTISHCDKEGVMVDHHWHDYYEILYVVDGKAHQTIDGEQFVISPRDIVVIEPGEVHATSSLSASCNIIVILFLPNAFLQQMGHLHGDYLKSPYACHKEIHAIFLKINTEYTQKQRGYESILNGCVYEFLGYLNRINRAQEADDEKENDIGRMRIAFSYIDEHIGTPLHLTEVSAIVGYSPAYFSKLFKKTAGQSFKAYIDNAKMLKAKRFILFENLSISETASGLGYEDVSTFCRAFKRVNGFSPSSLVAKKS